MNYIVMEYQTTNTDVTSTLVTVHTTREEAEQKYHMVLSAAAVSGLKYHGALLMDAFGMVYKIEHYPEYMPIPETEPGSESL
jgi:hypothetical protein